MARIFRLLFSASTPVVHSESSSAHASLGSVCLSVSLELSMPQSYTLLGSLAQLVSARRFHLALLFSQQNKCHSLENTQVHLGRILDLTLSTIPTVSLPLSSRYPGLSRPPAFSSSSHVLLLLRPHPIALQPQCASHWTSSARPRRIERDAATGKRASSPGLSSARMDGRIRRQCAAAARRASTTAICRASSCGEADARCSSSASSAVGEGFCRRASAFSAVAIRALSGTHSSTSTLSSCPSNAGSMPDMAAEEHRQEA